MSTRAVIAREVGPHQFRGRYHHFDGYPSGLGRDLWRLYHGKRGEAPPLSWEAFQAKVIDQRPGGWQAIWEQWDEEADVDAAPREITEATAAQYSCEFGYLLTSASGSPLLRIAAIAPTIQLREGKVVSYTPPQPFAVFADVFMDEPEPNWEALDEEGWDTKERLAPARA